MNAAKSNLDNARNDLDQNVPDSCVREVGGRHERTARERGIRWITQ